MVEPDSTVASSHSPSSNQVPVIDKTSGMSVLMSYGTENVGVLLAVLPVPFTLVRYSGGRKKEPHRATAAVAHEDRSVAPGEPNWGDMHR